MEGVVGDPRARPRVRCDAMAVKPLDLIGYPLGDTQGVRPAEPVVIIWTVEAAAVGPKVLQNAVGAAARPPSIVIISGVENIGLKRLPVERSHCKEYGQRRDKDFHGYSRSVRTGDSAGTYPGRLLVLSRKVLLPRTEGGAKTYIA